MNPESRRVLVTGAGGFFAQDVIKALRLSRRPVRCFGCDSNPDSTGAAFVEACRRVPAAEAPEYVEALDRLCRAERIDAVVPGSEAERTVLSRLGAPPRLPGGVAVVCQESSWVDVFGDKLLCMRRLRERVSLSPFADGSDAASVEEIVRTAGFPLVVKGRRSSGSKTTRVVESASDLSEALRRTPLPLVQAYLDESGGEFSAGVFAGARSVAVIAFRRELGPGGCSWYAENCEEADVRDYARRVADAIGLRGSANVQMRRTRDGVRLLEVNPRFSSLVAARALCGFRDLEWSIESALGEAPTLPDGPFRRIRYRRCFHEVVDLGSGYAAVAEWGLKTRRGGADREGGP